MKVYNQQKVQSFEKYDRYIFFVFLAMIAIIPIMISMHAASVVSPLITDRDIIRSGIYIDMFAYYKFVILIIMTLIALMLFIIKCVKGYKIKFDIITYILLLLAIVFLLTALFSTNSTIAFWGQYNRKEGAAAFVIYILLIFMAMNIQIPQKASRFFAYALIPFISVNLILVLLVVVGINIMESPILERLFTLAVDEELLYTERSSLMGTLNQWNNTSGFSASLIGFFITMAFIENNKKLKILYWVMALSTSVILVVNISTFGFICMFVFLVFALLYMLVKRQWLNIGFICLYIISVFLMTLMLSTSNATLWNASLGDRIWNESFGVLLGEKESGSKNEQIQTIINNEAQVKLSNIDFEISALPRRGNAPLSSRIYIWEKTLLILKNKPILGYGMDTLVYNFPHYNIDARSGISTEHLIVDKPHSAYLNIAYGTGIIGVLLCLAFLVSLIKIVIDDVKNNRLLKQKIPFIVLIVIYFMQAFLYDSVIGSTFIICIALGFYLNRGNIKLNEN